MADGPEAGQAARRGGRRYEALEDLLGRLISYAGLIHAGNTADPARAKFYGDVQERITAASTHLLFFTLELNRLDDGKLESRDGRSRARPLPAVDRGHPQGEALPARGPHRAALPREVGNGLFGLEPAVRRDHRRAALQGRTARRWRSSRRSICCRTPNEETRKAAAEALAKTFKENLRLFALITNTLAKDKEISDRWRGFADVADARHLSNRVEPEVVDALVAAVRAAYPRLSHRYYALKARWFGKKKLPHWDRNAPLPKVADPHHHLERGAGHGARRLWRVLARDGGDRASGSSTNSWIDAPVRPGKAPGAFAHPTVPSAHPYVLLNYQGKPRDVMTLAHELGHGVHQVLAAPNGALMAPTPLTLAETASVFGEMLTFRKLLAGITDQKQRKAMLAAKVEDMINTVVRQIAFYTFERKVHTERRERRAHRRAHRRNLDGGAGREPRAGDRARSPGYETFWAYIPHFVHSPFYVYAYAFGDCLVNSLYAVYEQLERRLRRALPRDARGRRHQAPLRTARAVRPRRPRPGLLAGRPGRDRADDRGAGGGWDRTDAAKHVLQCLYVQQSSLIRSVQLCYTDLSY